MPTGSLKIKIIMGYYYSKIIQGRQFDTVIEKVTGELQKEGFGVLTEIDVTATFKKKLDVDFKKYRILGACNPNFAYKALQVEDKIGTMLPCNVIVEEVEDNGIEVAVVDPVVSMKGVNNEQLTKIAGEVRDKLRRVVDNV
jgi:uncharacterized protein (DUF302 family)